MTPATTLTRAIEAAQSDPHGGKVMLTLEEAQAVLAELEAADALKEAGNQLRLAAAGYVAKSVAVQQWDNTLATYTAQETDNDG